MSLWIYLFCSLNFDCLLMFLLYCLISSPSSSVCTLTRDIPNLQQSSYASNQFFCTLPIIVIKNSWAASVWTYWSCWIHVHCVSIASSPTSCLVRIFVVKIRFYKKTLTSQWRTINWQRALTSNNCTHP
jgi:hypothetical protein